MFLETDDDDDSYGIGENDPYKDMPVSPKSIEWGFLDTKGKTLTPPADQLHNPRYGHQEYAKGLGLNNEIAAMNKGYVRYAIGNNGAAVFEFNNTTTTTHGRIAKFVAANKNIKGKVFVDDQADIRVYQNKAKAVSALRSLGEARLDTEHEHNFTEAALVQHGWRKLR